MKTLTIACMLAIMLAVLVEFMFSYFARLLGIDPEWHWLFLLIVFFSALGGLIWALIPRKDKDELIITPSVTDKDGTKVIIVKRSRWERFKEWWKTH